MVTELHETVTTAYLQGDELVLEEFRESDPDVVALVRESDDAELAVHRCLGMGARVLRLAGATLDTELVEHRFGEMTGALDRSIDTFAKRVDESAEKLLDEETGDLAKALQTWLDEVTSTLDATFDESSKKSALAKLETVLENARKEQITSMRLLLDPANVDSPLAGWRSEIVKTVEKQGEEIEKAIDELREQLAIDEARTEEAEHGTRKGFAFEDVVADQIAEIVRHFEDTVQSSGTEVGSTGSKVGDVVVTINPASTPGRTARYTLEVKDRRLTQPSALAELDEAMANRDATAAVMVFSRQTNCPVKTPFQWFDHKALVVLGKDELNPHALRLACLWARWMCLRDETTDAETIDTARVAALIDATRSALSTARTIRGSHTQAKRAIEQAGIKLDELTAGVTGTLDELEGVVCGTT